MLRKKCFFLVQALGSNSLEFCGVWFRANRTILGFNNFFPFTPLRYFIPEYPAGDKSSMYVCQVGGLSFLETLLIVSLMFSSLVFF